MIILIPIVILAGYLLLTNFVGMNETPETKSGLPLISGVSKVKNNPDQFQELNLNSTSLTVESFHTDSGVSEIISEYEKLMTNDGWVENRKFPEKDSWITIWKKDNLGSIIIAFNPSQMTKDEKKDIENLGFTNNGLVLVKGSWHEIENLG